MDYPVANNTTFSTQKIYLAEAYPAKPSASSKKDREWEVKGVNPVIEGREPVSPPE
jgi:hypothetical protein